jgi:hypothetical protein
VPEIIERVLAALIVIVLLGIVLYLGGVRLPPAPTTSPAPAPFEPTPRPQQPLQPAPQSQYKYYRKYEERFEESLDAPGNWYVSPAPGRNRTIVVEDDDSDWTPRYHRNDCNGGDCSCTCDQSAPYWARASNYCPD